MSEKLGLLGRRLGAIFYDSFIVFSWLILATALALIVNRGESLLPYRVYFLIYLVMMAGLFLSWFWHQKGQTLGMLAWKIRLVDQNNQSLSWSRAFIRYLMTLMSVGCAGIGLIWCLLDKEGQSLHDRFLQTKMVKVLNF